jgi:hypothetical protein
LIKVKLWSLNKDDQNQLYPVHLDEVRETETEKQLEDILVRNPDLLMPGLKLIGRQTTTDGGPLDLIGVDEDGNLIIFELKRGTLARDAIAQVIDYASFLDELDKETLFKHISDRSGYNEVEKIDFENWYQEQFSGNMDALDNPPKMVLVGLGADDRTRRMVSFLSKNGVDISLITFHAFKKDEQIFLAKQVEVELQEKEATQKHTYTKKSNEESLKRLAERIHATEILEKLTNIIRKEMGSAYEWPGKTGRSFAYVEKTDEGRPTYRVYLSIYLSENHPNSVQLYFQPRAIDAAKEAFDKLKNNYKELTLDPRYDSLHIWLKKGELLERFCEDLKDLIKQIETGWKNKQMQSEAE